MKPDMMLAREDIGVRDPHPNYRAPLKIDLLLSGGVRNGLKILMYWHIHSGFSAISAYPEIKIS
ncbi:MAG: hypothetical protein WCC11_10240, partial [Gammaproteobacteria bacterium]